MSWNNGYKRKQFEDEQSKLADKYRKAGMSDEQIRAMYIYDLESFNSDRRYYEHNTNPYCDDFGKAADIPTDSIPDELSMVMAKSDSLSRRWWIEDIDNKILAYKLKSFTLNEIELLTMLIYEECTQSYIAECFGISQRAVSKRFAKIRKILEEIF